MKRLLVVNACVRREFSRTNRLCRALVAALCAREALEVTELALEEERVAPLDAAALAEREEGLRRYALDGPAFRYARLLRDADIVVVAAPYWDLSFPASLKCFFEAASVVGVTFAYGEDGRPVGLCAAEKLYYVTTSGGYIGDANFGYDYVAGLCGVYGIRAVACLSAQGLDVAGNDVEAILREASDNIGAL